MTENLYWISAAVFALLMLLIWINVKGNTREGNAGKNFHNLNLWCVFFCIQDMLWGMCYTGVIKNDIILFITSTVFHLSAAVTTFFWVKYVIDFIGKKDKIGKAILAYDCVVICMETVLLVINCFKPVMFSVADGVFEIGTFRQVTLLCQFLVYLTIGVVTIVLGLRESGEDRKKYFAVFGFTMAPILFGVLQLFYPDGPFYSMGYCIGCFIINGFIIAKDRATVLDSQNLQIEEISALNVQLREKQTSLEEAASEQEAQLEEIAALNTQLENNQAEMEAAATEQEAQIEEIQSLNRSLSEYNDALANAGYGMWHIILKDGAAPRMQVNEKMAELLGITGQNLGEEELYNAWYGQIVPDAIPSVQASVGEMMAGKFSENTYQWVHPSKGTIYVRCGGTCKTLEDGTNILSGYHADVTDIVYEEKKHNEELEEARRIAEEEEKKVSEAYGMIEGLSQDYHTIWVVDKVTSKMHLIRSSGVSTIKGAVQMGKDMPEFDVGFDKYINTYVEPEDRERMHREIAFAEILRQLRENPKKLYAVNYLRRDESGHVGYHQIAFANADTKEGKQQFVYGFRDVDKLVKEEQAQKEEFRRAKNAAEAANHAKSAFLFNMSHDIRTPMNAIIGYANLMKRNQDNMEKWPEYLDKILASSDFLLGLINNVLEMARIESGKMALDENVYAAESFVDQLYSVFADEMKKKNLEFTTTVNIEHQYFCADTVKLKEIYLNIISNAQKYTLPGGAVNVTVNEIPSDLSGYAIIETSISDTGIGMSEEFLPHVFEEFTRERNSVGNSIQGTGLGMPIVKKLVDLMGGTIEVKSKLGAGTTFVVTIPHRIAEKPETEAKPENIDCTSFEGKRILLAEDNDLNAEIAIEILSEYGFNVERAEDGVVCVDMLKKADCGYYDLILMDIQMPNLDGYGATRLIRKLEDPEKANIPIIAMTANAFDEDKRNAIDAGMDGHISKPIEIPVLVKTLADVFNDRSSVIIQTAKTDPDEDTVAHVKKIYFEMQRSKAVSVLPGGFFAYMAEQPEKLIFANDLCCSIWGCKDYNEFNELVGGSFRGIVHPDDYERAEKEIWHQIDNGDTGLDQVKYRIIKKDGSTANISDYGRLIRDDEVGDIFYVFVAEDL